MECNRDETIKSKTSPNHNRTSTELANLFHLRENVVLSLQIIPMVFPSVEDIQTAFYIFVGKKKYLLPLVAPNRNIDQNPNAVFCVFSVTEA